jgi:hypothetical protein
MQAPPDGSAETLARLIYRSRAKLDFGGETPVAVLLEIVTQARKHNERNGLTGILLFDGFTFLQVLEGPLSAIERTYERIACDQRHTELEVIDLSVIESRDYMAWSMAMLDASEGRFPSLAPYLCRGGEARCAELRAALTQTLAQTLSGPRDAMAPV